MLCSIAPAARRGAPKTISLAMLAGGLLLALGAAWSAPAAAQDTQSLINRIDRLERDIQTMSRQVYSGGAPKGGSAPVSGGSVPSGDYAARLEDRISQLESQISQMTGTVETLMHSNSELSAQIERMNKDNEIRFRQLEGAGAAPAAQAAPPAQTASRDGNLGTLNPRDVQAAPKGGAAPAPAPRQSASLPAGSPQQQYDYAYGLLSNARSETDYNNAAQAFKDFLDKNPSGPLASAARYWQGQSYFVNKDYQQAASIFLDGYQKDQKGQKAPDTLLKLGMSLTALDKKKEACATFDKLTKDFPGPAKEFKNLPNERKRAGCA